MRSDFSLNKDVAKRETTKRLFRNNALYFDSLQSYGVLRGSIHL